jgi:plasmid stability protein
MTINLSIKGLPDAVYERLKEIAAANRPSRNGQILAILEAEVLPRRRPVQKQFVPIRAARSQVEPTAFEHDEIDHIKRAGCAQSKFRPCPAEDQRNDPLSRRYVASCKGCAQAKHPGRWLGIYSSH